MRITIDKPRKCPARKFNGQEHICGVVKSAKVVCDDNRIRDFEFPKGCPIVEDGYVLIRKELKGESKKTKKRIRKW